MRSLSFSARLPVALLVLMSGLSPARVEAQEVVNHLYDKFQFGASAAAVVLSSDIRIDNADGSAGTDIDLGDIGISKTTFSPAVVASWRPGKRHELQLGYLYVSRSGDKTLTEDISFGDTSFTVGAEIKSKFSAPTLALNYRFAFMAKENTQIGFQVGVGALFFGIDLDALAGVGNDTTTVSYSANKNLTGPTATLGLFGNFRAGDHWYFGVNAGALGASISGITATIWSGGGDARYFFNDHWALSGGWTINGFKISSDPDNDGSFIDLGGSIKYTFQVFRIGVIYALH
jgi:hypothetical protein